MFNWFKTYKKDVVCNDCFKVFSTTFKKGEPVTNQLQKCPWCGNSGLPYFNKCHGGWQALYIGKTK